MTMNSKMSAQRYKFNVSVAKSSLHKLGPLSAWSPKRVRIGVPCTTSAV